MELKYSTLNSRVLIIRAPNGPKKVPLIFGNSHMPYRRRWLLRGCWPALGSGFRSSLLF